MPENLDENNTKQRPGTVDKDVSLGRSPSGNKGLVEFIWQANPADSSPARRKSQKPRTPYTYRGKDIHMARMQYSVM